MIKNSTPKKPKPEQASTIKATADSAKTSHEALPEIEEINGRKGPEPTRYNDWEVAGKCVDF